ncbi:MAG: pyridoxal phosphate-dependent aminotransferase [Gammaproteobacteria bacterium]|nr:pyridoxal phosphate-dependent aminotransferase [Gammaproteobacteria bacterium]MBU1415599.1 pyridoxal phosphate-dependent aminotransferase [Gammaproteobacteria bacterium]
MEDIEPFHVMELMAKAHALEARGRDIIHMEVGEPDFPTPQSIVEAAQRFIATGHVHYTHALGLPQLREAIARYYQDRYRMDVEPERIIVTAGASGALLLALSVLIDPGDSVLMADPGYPCNRNFVRAMEGLPVPIPLDATTAFQPTAEHVAAHWTGQTRALLVATPSNPTGTIIELTQLRALHQAVVQRGGTMLVDEIYHGLTYGFDAETALSIGDDIFVINSFSKYFGMTGWRLGWLVAPRTYVRDIEKLAQNLFISPSAPAQYAAMAAFGDDTIEILEARREEFRQRRDVLLPGLRELGFTVATEPLGAFYVYADSSRHADDSYTLADALLAEAGVAATPGLDFGVSSPARHMRFAYTIASVRIEEGLARMRNYLRTANG